jgi:hypothetical protein
MERAAKTASAIRYRREVARMRDFWDRSRPGQVELSGDFNKSRKKLSLS